jgi:hypothetical protein
MDILLVVGNSAPEHYKPLVEAMVADGLAPEVIHFRRPVRKGGVNLQLYLDILKRHDDASPGDEWTEDEFKQWAIRRSDEIQVENLQDELAGHAIEDIKAVLYPHDGTDSGMWHWLARSLPETIASYQVIQAENSQPPFLLGVGYGSTLAMQ